MEVPVDADYVVIGVLAEKSDIKMTAPKQQQPQHASTKGKRKAKATAEEGLPAEAKVDNQLNGDAVDDQIDDEDPDRPHQQTQRKKRYIMFKLLDMRLRRDGLSSAGDSMLNLIMFEADSSRETINAESDDELVNEQTGARMKKAERQSKKTQNRCYKGGSRGAYEKFWKEPNGTVIAVLNPKVLKPRPVSRHFREHTIAYQLDLNAATWSTTTI